MTSIPPVRPEPASPISRPAGRAGGILLLSLLSLTLLPGCATKRDLRDLRDEVRARATVQDSALTRIDRLARAALDSLASQRGELVQLRGDLARQLLAIEEQLVQIQELTGQSQRRLAEVRDQLERRSMALERRTLPVDTGGVEPGREPEPLLPTAETTDPEEAYQESLAQLQRGSHVAARLGFQDFLRLFPDHELAPDARFWRAQTYEQENRVDEAIEEYLMIRELHPAADRVPAALYRVGLLELDRGNREEAREYFQLIVDEYPDSDASVLAGEKLDEIGR